MIRLLQLLSPTSSVRITRPLCLVGIGRSGCIILTTDGGVMFDTELVETLARNGAR